MNRFKQRNMSMQELFTMQLFFTILTSHFYLRNKKGFYWYMDFGGFRFRFVNMDSFNTLEAVIGGPWIEKGSKIV